MRLAIKKELVLDEAENAIRECIAAFEKKPVELDAEWQRKVARARAELSVRKYKEEQAAKAAPKGRVTRTLNANNPADAVEMARMLGIKPGADLIGYTGGYILNGKHK